ncbi:MAG: molybdopterin-dependent oxidoreductase, partial [Phycisphaeraceae bacterium]|nr:molybdopterin-dependent oxidoreductase [Phycisphaeraceae bacterium]
IDGITASGDNIAVHHNEGKVYRVKPRTNMDVNKWWISDEIRYGWKFVHDENRLGQPVRKQLGVQVGAEWPRAIDDAVEHLREATQENGRLAAVISPMLGCEEAWLLGRFVRALDPGAILAVGPVPVDGEDQSFPGGYTVRAEKAPNQRGVKRALAMLEGDAPIDASTLIEQLADDDSPVTGLLVTGNYPDPWPTDELVKAIGRKRKIVMIDTLPNKLTEKADVLLPGATWLEKAGCFENIDGRLQSFEAAIPVMEDARSEGQIALELLAAADQQPRAIYDADTVREQMGGAFVAEVHHPQADEGATSDLEYVEL